MNLDRKFVFFFVLSVMCLILVINTSPILDNNLVQTVIASSNYDGTENEFISYYNPYEMIKIQYPSFWSVSEFNNNNAISFLSPFDQIGVLVQNKPTLHVSIDEITMRTISGIKSSFQNSQILAADVLNEGNESATQVLIFKYGNEFNDYKILIHIRAIDDRFIIFSYYSETGLFDRFLPLAQHMHSTLQTPLFDTVFSSNNKIDALPNTLQVINYSQLTEENNLTSYNNERLGISIDYPISFKKIEEDSGVLFSSGNNSRGITMSRMALPNGTYNDFVANHMLSLNQSLNNFRIINSSITDVLEYPTPMILFTYENGTQTVHGLQLWKLIDESVFIFTYIADSNALFNNFISNVLKMIDSLKIRGL